MSTRRSLRVNNRVIADPRDEIKKTDIVDGHIVVLKIGARQQVILHIDEA